MCPKISCLRGGIFTLVAFVNRPIQVIFGIINVHDFIQFDASFFAACVQLTKKGKMVSLQDLQYLTRYDETF